MYNVNNALLMKFEAIDCKDCFHYENQVEFSKGDIYIYIVGNISGLA